MFIRELLYPLGLIASVLFAARFIHQWALSEKKKQSHVTATFWKLSLIANLILVIHSLIQVQFPICLIQTVNGAISWRNLNLMKKRPLKTPSMIALMSGLIILTSVLFIFLSGPELSWMRAPKLPWTNDSASALSLPWHSIGFLGLTLFASRFWIQWWLAEKHKKSYLGSLFWWVSLIGGLLALAYFFKLSDPVNIIGYGAGLIPYARNLVLLRRSKHALRPQKERVFVFAGEKSADVLGANLIDALKKQRPRLSYAGVGGERMAQTGMSILMPTKAFSVMGFSAVIKALPKLVMRFHQVKKAILDDNPKAVILIDYPEFNLLLAKALRKKGYAGKIIQYVSPTVWAWRKGRIKKLEKRYNLLLAILPFEKEVYAHSKLPVEYVGHPLVTHVHNHPFNPTWKKECGLPDKKPLIALFPGSRYEEIAFNLPKQLEAAGRYTAHHHIALSFADERLKPAILAAVKKSGLIVGENLSLIPSTYRYEMMREAVAALATSGTVTFELALFNTPTAVCYTLSKLNYFLARYIFRIKVPYISLVNLICKKEVFPEFIALKLSSEKLEKALAKLMDSEEKKATIEGCSTFKEHLTQEDASLKAAATIGALLYD